MSRAILWEARILVSRRDRAATLPTTRGFAIWSAKSRSPLVMAISCVSLLFGTWRAQKSWFRGAEEILRRQKPVRFFECSMYAEEKLGTLSGLRILPFGPSYNVRNAVDRSGLSRHQFEGAIAEK